MKIELVRIGNSRGLRLPKRILDLYGIEEGDRLELEERREGILIRPGAKDDSKLSWEASYKEMAADAAEAEEWAAWDGLAGDGLDD